MPHDPTPLVGRASVVAEVVRRARSGQGTVFIGPPGSGGSRLLEEVQQGLRRVGARTARLRIPGPGQTTSESPFLALLDRSRAEALSAADRTALRSAVLDLQLDALAVEDAHLLAAVEGAIVIDLARAGIAVVANAAGPGGMADALRVLEAEQRVVPTPLGRLRDDEVAELAEHLLGDLVEGDLALALAAASEGRPGTLQEVIDDGVAARAIALTDGLWRLVAPLPPARSVRAAAVDAFSALPPDQRGWIAAVATARGIAHDLAPRIAAPVTMVAAAEAGWTVTDGDGTRIASHPMGTAVLGSLDPRARSAVLRRLVGAAASARRPLTEPEQVALARWRIELGEAPDADELLALAGLPGTEPEMREELLRAALAAGAPAGAALADHLRRTRRPAEALQLIDAALPTAASEEEHVALLRVATLVTGIVERRSAEALDALDALLAHRDPHPDLLAVRAGLLLMEGRPRDAVDAATAVLASDDVRGFAAAFAHLQVAVGLRELGELDAALAAAARFVTLPDVERSYPAGAALGTWVRAEIAVAVGVELAEAEAAMRAEHEAVPLERRTALRPPIAYTLGCIRIHQADPVAAARLLREADAGSDAWREGWRPRVLAELTIAQTLSGAVVDAAGTLDRLLQIACPPVQHGRVRLATAQLTAARGDRGAAADIAAGVAEEGRRRGLALDVFDGTFAGIRYGDPDAAERLLAIDDPVLAGSGRDAQRAYAAAVRSGDPHSMRRAAETLWAAGLRFHAIEAAARAADLGDAAAEQRLVAWLSRAPGLRLPCAAGRRNLVLTAREREVALLAARGESDRSIAVQLGISVRTAQTHLGRALAKLGIHRRTELPGLIADP